MRRQLLAMALVIGAAPVLAGCAFLDPPSFDDGFGEPIATYVTGRATLEVGGRTIVLDHLNPGPHIARDMGTNVYWYNDEGWGLRLTSYGGELLPGGDITIDRVQTTYWSAPGYGACAVKTEKADTTGAKGSATCRGLRWIDQLHGGSDFNAGPSYVDGEPAFDATVQFEAWPELRTPASAAPAASPTAAAG